MILCGTLPILGDRYLIGKDASSRMFLGSVKAKSEWPFTRELTAMRTTKRIWVPILVCLFLCVSVLLTCVSFDRASNSQTLYQHHGPSLSVALTSNNSVIASGGADGVVCIYSLKRLTVLKHYALSGVCSKVRFSEGGAYLGCLSGFFDGKLTKNELTVIQMDCGRINARIDLSTHFCRSFAFLNKNADLAIACGSNVRLVNINRPNEFTTLVTDCDGIYELICSQDEKYLAATTSCDHVLIWDLLNHKLIRKYQTKHVAEFGIAFSTDSRLFAFTLDGIVQVAIDNQEDAVFAKTSASVSLDLSSTGLNNNGEITFALPRPSDPVNNLLRGCSIRCIDNQNRTQHTIFRLKNSAISEYAFLSDSRRVVAGLYDGRVILGDLDSH